MLRYLFVFALSCSFVLGFTTSCKTVNLTKRIKLPYGKGYKNWREVTSRPLPSLYHGGLNQRIYANEKAYRVSTGKENLPYPEGATFIMTFFNKDGDQTKHAYVMRKMPKGYDNDNGNWYYGIFQRSDWTLDKVGSMPTCIKCHYQKTHKAGRDYIPFMKKDMTGDL